jgi:hypothetical protein
MGTVAKQITGHNQDCFPQVMQTQNFILSISFWALCVKPTLSPSVYAL